MHSHSVITYIVVLPEDSGSADTPFQGFAVRSLRTLRTLRSISKLPATFVEMHLARQAMIAERAMSGGYQIVFLDVSTIEELPEYPAVRFLVVISGPGTDEVTAASVARSEFPILHVTTTRSSSILYLNNLTAEQLRNYCNQAITYIQRRHNTFITPELKLPTRDIPLALPLQSTDHFVAVPNEIVLESLGYCLESGKSSIEPMTVLSPDNAESDGQRVKLILDSAKVLAEIRTTAVARSSLVPVRTAVDLILTAPAVYHHFGSNQL